MKKIIVLLFMFSLSVFPQENNKGNIKFFLEGEKIDLPVSYISLNEGNDLTLIMRAENNNEEVHKLVSMEIKFDSNNFKENAAPKDIRLNISIQNKYQTDGQQLSVHYPPGSNKSEISYTIRKNGERINWELSSLQMNFNISDISFSDGALRINGTFSLKFRSSLSENKNNIFEVKDGAFKIII